MTDREEDPLTAREGDAITDGAGSGVLATSVLDLVATLPGIVWEADATRLTMTFVSPRARDLLGHDPADWVRVPGFWEDHLHPEDRDRAIREAGDAVADLATRALHYRFRTADGRYRHFRDIVRVIDQADGHRHIVGFMVDVTDQASAEAQRDLLAAAVDQAAESVVVTDAHGTIVYVNPAFEEVTGYPRAEVLGRNPRILKSGVQSPAFYTRMWRTLLSGRSWSGDLVNRRRDGTTYVEEATITPVHGEKGGLHYVAVKHDVTRQRADREARDRFAAIVASAADAAYAVALDGTVLAWNEAAARIYGWAPDEILGRALFELAAVEEHERIRALLARVGAGESVGPLDAVQRTRDGRTLLLSVSCSPVRDEDGRVTAVATIARDVSEERRLAEERAGLEAQLRQAQKLEAIGRLAGGVAHDFNNLLTAILGYASMVATQLEGPQLDDQRQVIHAAERGADLTRRLLAFSRSVPADPRPVAIDTVLADAHKLVGRLVPERITFELRACAGAWVLADPVEIEQIVMNLVVNAVDAIPDSGAIVVESELLPSPAGGPGGRVVLGVRDTGSGMDAETAEHIFEPFYTTKGVGEGTGLGLATVYGIVQRLGGRIEVSSEPGAGTSFRIHLAAVGPDGEQAADAGTVQEPAGAGRVLLVEDSPAVRQLAERMLRAAGYEVEAVATPAAALARGASGLDAIVTDVVMPGMSGPELVERLATDLPVVFISGYTAGHPPAELAHGPGRAFLEKPFTGAQLAATLREAIEGGKAVSAGG